MNSTGLRDAQVSRSSDRSDVCRQRWVSGVAGCWCYALEQEQHQRIDQADKLVEATSAD